MHLKSKDQAKIYTSGFILLVLTVYLFPIFKIAVLAISRNSDSPWGWVTELLHNSKYSSALFYSLIVGVSSAIGSTILAFYFALNFYFRKYIWTGLFLLIALLAIPPVTQALSIKYLIIYLLHIRSSPLAGLIFAHISAALPLCTVIVFSGLSGIERNCILAAGDLGGSPSGIIFRIIIPLIKRHLLNALLLGFLISLNEFSRSFYLNGGNELISTIIFSNINSGIQSPLYALILINVILGVILLGSMFPLNALRRRS